MASGYDPTTSPTGAEPEPPVDKAVAALVKAQGEFSTVEKKGHNPHFRSSYAKLDDIVEMWRPVLMKNGLAIVSKGVHTEDGWELVTRLYHTSGQYLESTLPLGQVASAQALGSAMTYMRRYAGSALLSIVSDEDDDGNSATGSAPESKQQERRSSGSKAPTTKKAPRKKAASTGSKAGDGTPPKAGNLAALWPQVYLTGTALGMETEQATEWFRGKLQEWNLPGSTKDLEAQQVNKIMVWLKQQQEKTQQDTGEPEQGQLGGGDEEPPPPTDEDK